MLSGFFHGLFFSHSSPFFIPPSYLCYIHMPIKKMFQKDAFICLLRAMHSNPVWKTTSMMRRFRIGSPFSYLAIVLSQNPIFSASSRREIFKATRCRFASLPSFFKKHIYVDAISICKYCQIFRRRSDATIFHIGNTRCRYMQNIRYILLLHFPRTTCQSKLAAIIFFRVNHHPLSR